MSDLDNQNRANRAKLTLAEYFKLRGDQQDSPMSEEDLTDLITDLMHLCEREGLSVQHLYQSACLHYQAESTGHVKMPEYDLFEGIDGLEFGKQRELLTMIIDGESYKLQSGDFDLLEGLRNLLDNVADIASDYYQVECGYGDPYPLEDWQREVANGDTRLGYEEWKEHMIESNQE